VTVGGGWDDPRRREPLTKNGPCRMLGFEGGGALRPKRVTVSPRGRMVIPTALRKSLGVEAGDQVVVDLKDGDLRVRSLDAVVARAQALVRQYVPDDVSLVD